MEDIAFSDWPGQPVDLSGSNPWLPAYGFQPPHTLLDKEDFIGNPDADLFLQGNVGQYMYLETIQEETSDDLQSESDQTDSRGSPVGWLASDSEAGSVIRIDITALDEIDSESEREIACPAKRRRHDINLLGCSDDESNYSLSRSSSLLQFETLERQCQDISNSSPSIFSAFSYDSLENRIRKTDLSPDSLEHDDGEPESEYYKSLKVDLPRTKRNSNNNNNNNNNNKSCDSLLYNAARLSDSDSSESTDSERTLANSKSNPNLKMSRSFDNLQKYTKISAENLSEDSGYSEHFCNLAKNKSNSIPSLNSKAQFGRTQMNLKNSYVAFEPCDVEYTFPNILTNFGSSYRDLSVFDKYDVSAEIRNGALFERFARNNGVAKKRMDAAASCNFVTIKRTNVNSEIASECDDAVWRSKYNAASASEPCLLCSGVAESTGDALFSVDLTEEREIYYGKNHNYYESIVCVSSVPKDLHLAGHLKSKESWSLDFFTNTSSIAAKNCDIADFTKTNELESHSEKIMAHGFLRKESSDSETEITSFLREGSYLEGASNKVDFSDDEYNPCYSEDIRKSTIVEFDKKILRTISETSIQSFNNDDGKLDAIFSSTPVGVQTRNVASTPNLTLCKIEIANASGDPETTRNSSLMNRSSSTSGVSDEEKPVLLATKSFGGSSGSKGVHFCPVVAEVNWHDNCSDTTTEKESSYSLSSTPEIDVPQPPTPPLVRPKPRRNPSPARMSSSEPELQNNHAESPLALKFEYVPLTPRTVSQPDIGGLKRRGSKVTQNDPDGSVLLAYVDGDGIKYKHSHLGDVYQSMPPTPAVSHVPNTSRSGINNRPQAKLLEKDEQVSAFVPRMEQAQVQARREPKKTGKLGGFFSRIASFRFSNRKSDEKSKERKSTPVTQQQRIATKDDYIYIPLRGPEKSLTDNNNQQVPLKERVEETACVSAKPPLPKVPPRVVGASVKRRTTEAFAQPVHPEYQTIDSGDALPRPMEPMGLIETDLDTEVTVITSGAHAKTRSLMNLGAEAPPRSLTAPPHPNRPHKSMEFLLDKQNLKVVEPPENELQKGERVMSEHQLRIQRSLQKLTIPDWYKQYQTPREGFLLKNKGIASRERWTGTATSKTPSLSSLGSNTLSPMLLSPTPHTQPFVRWSTSKLNSTASSPCASTRSSFNARQPNGSISPSSARSSFSYRQPYLGWRSQERLTRPRTPAERLASSLLATTQIQQTQDSPEIHTSIKEVTSAIVHYVSALKPELESRGSSVSPRGSQKLCWLESSFVGVRPVDSPQTPISLAEGNNSTPVPSNLRLELQKNHNDQSTHPHSGHTKPSPSSTTLEDVLDSLLGLPPSTRVPSPSHQETASANSSPSRLGKETRVAEQFRRHSEGSEPVTRQTAPPPPPRRVSFHSSPVLRCRYSRCARVVSTASNEAQSFKHCHNCSYMYCSRACRRAHWEKHRKSCLFSRVGALCRQVLAAAKEQNDTLLQISLIARRGYLSHGVGAVKCFFPCPEAGEKFLTGGLGCLGELTYVRWSDLLPTEMGPQMYTELVKMCKNYNPDTKLVLYVTVCVVSEVPASGAVKWERQLVSRCAKMRLSKEVPIPERDTIENLETLVLTCAPTTNGKSREHVFSNVQCQLKMRGVSLRRQYPEVYQQLCTYVEGKCQKFIPLTVYPKDDITGKSFMCIIMLDSDPEGVRQVSAAGVRVNTVNLLQNCDID